MNQNTISGYQLLKELGGGGSATVWEAIDLGLKRKVAIKVFHQSVAENPTSLKRIHLEGELLASLKHPHIVEVFSSNLHDAATAEPRHLVMEFMEGGTLEKKMKHGRLSPTESVRIVLQILDALDFAHARSIVHRDVKPGNILFDLSGRAHLSDFSIAKQENTPGFTMVGTTLGTPHYMAPEQVGSSEVDLRADLYSLGVVLFEMLAGQLPFQGKSTKELYVAHLTAQPPALEVWNPAIPAALVAAVNKALSKRPEDRYQDASRMKQAIEAVSLAPDPFHAAITADRPGQKATDRVRHETMAAAGARMSAAGPTRFEQSERLRANGLASAAPSSRKRNRALRGAMIASVLAAVLAGGVVSYRERHETVVQAGPILTWAEKPCDQVPGQVADCGNDPACVKRVSVCHPATPPPQPETDPKPPEPQPTVADPSIPQRPAIKPPCGPGLLREECVAPPNLYKY